MDSYDNDLILLFLDDDLFPTDDENESFGTAIIPVTLKGDSHESAYQFYPDAQPDTAEPCGIS